MVCQVEVHPNLMSGYMPKMRQIRVVFVIYGHYISLIIEPKLTLFSLRVTFRSVGLQTPLTIRSELSCRDHHLFWSPDPMERGSRR